MAAKRVAHDPMEAQQVPGASGVPILHAAGAVPAASDCRAPFAAPCGISGPDQGLGAQS